MTLIQPHFELECSICHIRLDHNAAVEAYQLHMQVDHDRDEVHLDLVTVCTCGTTMTFVKSVELASGTIIDKSECICGNIANVTRKP